MEHKEFGYIRVSTREQNIDRQLIALQACGILSENIFTDKLSGKSFDRPQYQKMLKKIKPGDTLFVKSIDRLGRNDGEILEQWKLITKDKNVDLYVVDMPLLDTRREKNLLGTLISDLV